jgi:tetratricopeptide (TPR) repeat protein
MPFHPEMHAAPRAPGYRIEAFLGKGANGLVFKAFDIAGNFYVALKSIRYPEQDGIYRLKQEFRWFCDFLHPNIVELYNLYVDETHCFYTMELIEGLDFVSATSRDSDSLRSCLLQLADGLSAIHSAGRLHRDLKPSNIIVEPTGRAVLLDFGLSVETQPKDSVLTQAQLFGGTPAYMAPEQWNGQPASEFSDLYALGVLIWETLAGARPYDGLSVAARLEGFNAPPVIPPNPRLAAHPDLGRLAVELMAFDPKARPPLVEVRRRLADPHAWPVFNRRIAQQSRAPPFVNRGEELAALESALDEVAADRRIAVQVSGLSGAGKSALVERFLARARQTTAALALRSRCHHRESVRYNAVDGLIDMLSHYLVNESEPHLADMAPGDVSALLTMFPVLARVSWLTGAVDDDPQLSDTQGVARAAVAALCELLDRVSAGRPLIFWIDDLHWSDAASLPLLTRILSTGQAPILTILSYHSEDLADERIAESLGGAEAESARIEVRRLPIGPLTQEHVASLLQAAEGDVAPSPEHLDEVLRVSGGLPFFVLDCLAEPGAQGGVDDRVAARLATLSPTQRAMLEIVAVAGRPIAQTAAVRIAAPENSSGREIYQLLNQNLLRRAETSGEPGVETYHDRIRAATLATMPLAQRRRRHLAIAEEAERAPDPDHTMLVEHFIAAEERTRALEHALLAARQARRRLAFPQAVAYFQLAAELKDAFADEAGLAVELAESLADAGRSSEAADLFLRAAEANRQTPRRAAGLEARAARELLFSGRLSESRALHQKLFTSLGITFPDSAGAAYRMSAINRVVFAARLAWRRGRPSVRAGRDTERLDILWSAAIGFVMTDFVVGDALLTRFMREAVALGEPSRLLRAIAMESTSMANLNFGFAVRRAERLLKLARTLAERSDDPYDRVVLQTCTMGNSWLRGRFAEAAELAREAVDMHRREWGRFDFVATIAQSYRIAALAMAGNLRTLRIDALAGVEDARARGDAYVARSFRSGYYVFAALADDNPAGVIADSLSVLNDVPSDRFTSQHWLHFIATTNALVYAGEPWEALALVEQQWSRLRAAGFLNLGLIGAHLIEYRVRVALSCASAQAPAPAALARWTRTRLLNLASKGGKAVARRAELSHSEPTAAAIRAAIAGAQGDLRVQRKELDVAISGFERAGMPLHLHSAILSQAALTGKIPPESTLAWFEREGVRRPARMAAFLSFLL